MADILLVEDDKVNAKLASLIVTKKGFTLDHVESGEKAVDACSKNSYRLVLMDINMPGMDGIETTQKLRETFSPEELPVVLMTAMTPDEIREKSLGVLINDAMEKPLDMGKLAKLADAWLS